MGRRVGESKPTLPLSDAEGEVSGGGDGTAMIGAEEADVAREQFPFIFNLLRGHAINTQAVGSRSPGAAAAAAGRQGSVENRRSKTSRQQQQQTRKPAAVAICRQHEATPSGREGKTPDRPESVRPQRRLLPASSVDVINHSPASATSRTSPSAGGHGLSTTTTTTCSTVVTSAPFVSRAALMANRRAQQCTVAADVHVSPDADGEITDDVTSAGSSRQPGRYCSATVGSFRRRDRLRSSLPVVSAMNKSMERPLGIVFLVFRNETRPGLLPNEVSSINTVWALFVRAFSDSLSMQWFESSKWTVYFLDPVTGVYRVLQDLRTISDRSILRLEECETCLAPDCNKTASNVRASRSPVSLCDVAVSTKEDLLSSPPLFRPYSQQRHPTTTTKDSSVVKPDGMSSPSDRLSAMETRVDSLAALVQCAIMRPTDSVDSLASDSSQATAVHNSPLSDRKLVGGGGGDDVTSRLRDILRQTRELKSETQLLRQVHVEHVTGTKQLLQAAFVKIKAVMSSALKQGSGDKTVRQQIIDEQGGYCLDAARVEEQLRNLEACVEELRADVVSGKSQVVLSDVEAMVLALGHIGRSLASLRGDSLHCRLHHLQERMKPVMASEIEVVVQEERFIKEEPHRLDKSVVRCKQLSGTLSTLKKLAMVQGSGSPESNSDQPPSKPKLRSPTTVRNHITRNYHLQQVCRLSSDEADSSGVEGTTTAGGAPAAATPRPRSSSRSSYSGTSTGSDAPSNNGPLDDIAVFDDNDCNGQRGLKDHRPSTEAAPPVPPPRRYAMLQPGSGDVWQRQAVRPATDGVHRRVLAAASDNGPSLTPRSCPSSPLLDGVGLRRAGGPQDGIRQSPIIGGRNTHPPPSQNDHGAAMIGSTTTPITRRTKLPLSPLVRTQRDVR